MLFQLKKVFLMYFGLLNTNKMLKMPYYVKIFAKFNTLSIYERYFRKLLKDFHPTVYQ